MSDEGKPSGWKRSGTKAQHQRLKELDEAIRKMRDRRSYTEADIKELKSLVDERNALRRELLLN